MICWNYKLEPKRKVQTRPQKLLEVKKPLQVHCYIILATKQVEIVPLEKPPTRDRPVNLLERKATYSKHIADRVNFFTKKMQVFIGFIRRKVTLFYLNKVEQS